MWARFYLVFATLLVVCLCACSNGREPINSSITLPAPIKLKVGEGFVNPIGYYESQPRFSWQMVNKSSLNQNSHFQQAYQIQVANQFPLQGDAADLWDSGKIESNQNAWIKYQGKPLASRQQFLWRVRFWDQDANASNWSEPQSVELGLLANKDWQGQWIGHPATALELLPSQETLATPQYLRKEFAIQGEVEKARLYVTAKGLFKAYINGEDVAPNDVMTPGWTPYKKRIETLTYDVTKLLNAGNNTLASSIAGGWYAGRVSDFVEREHKLPARLLAQLEITYKNGESKVITSDDSWQVTQDGPVRFASIYDGERYQQANELTGWNSVGYVPNEKVKWTAAVADSIEPIVALRPKRHAPIRHVESLPAVAIVSDAQSHSNGVVIYDFGQNMVGVPHLQLPVISGQEVKVRYAEALHKGEFYTDNYRSAKSTNYFMPSTTGTANYQPQFTYHGYRYIEVSGFDSTKSPQLDWAEAMVQHSDVQLHATFESSHPKLNKLSQNVQWGLRSNFYDIPLDCPQRDERLGWTGDAQVFVTPSMYLADVYGFWAAWLESVREEQGENGKIPLYIPFVDWINFASSGWGDAVTVIPWELFMLTGDKQILQDNYPMMKKWIDYHRSQSKNYVSSMMTFGDWLQPFAATSENNNGNRGDTDFNLISTAYFARSVELAIQSALVLGLHQEARDYTNLYIDIKSAFRSHFFDDSLNLKQGKPTQTTYLLGLNFGLFNESEIALAQAKLLEQIELANNHLRTGFLGTPLLMDELQRAGRTDLAYELLFKETYPSWFYSINNGATTTWERWNSYSLEEGFNPQGMNSLNHYAYGSVYRWFYEGILGIKAVEPGFTKVQIAPQIGSQLDNASGQYQTPQGIIKVAWEKTDEAISLKISVPPNTLAEVVVPAGYINDKKQEISELSTGDHVVYFHAEG